MTRRRRHYVELPGWVLWTATLAALLHAAYWAGAFYRESAQLHAASRCFRKTAQPAS